MEKISNVAQTAPLTGSGHMAPAYPGIAWSEGNPDYGQYPGDSSLQNPCSPNGTLLFLRNSNGYLGVQNVTTKQFLGWIPIDSSNAVHVQNNPAWDAIRVTSIILTVGNGVYRQPWDNFGDRILICTAPPGFGFIPNGGDGDMDDFGRYYPVMLSTGYDPGSGQFQNVQTGIVDLSLGKLCPILLPGKPDNITVSPSGQYFGWFNHNIGVEPNKFYRCTELMAGIVRPLNLPSALGSNGEGKSIGHAGWATDDFGFEVFCYGDNRNDKISTFCPSTGGAARAIFNSVDMGYPNMHICRRAPKGYMVISTYGANVPGVWPLSRSIILVKLADGSRTEICKTNTIAAAGFKDNEAACQIDFQGKWGYWASNNNRTDNLEAWRVEIPAIGTVPVPTPIPTPTPAPTPAPAPTIPAGATAAPTYTKSGSQYLWVKVNGVEQKVRLQ